MLKALAGIPSFIDAAADVPPVENHFKYQEMGFDLVTFSGGNEEELNLGVVTLKPKQVPIVAERVREVLSKAAG